jgi:hypothetical protein
VRAGHPVRLDLLRGLIESFNDPIFNDPVFDDPISYDPVSN